MCYVMFQYNDNGKYTSGREIEIAVSCGIYKRLDNMKAFKALEICFGLTRHPWVTRLARQCLQVLTYAPNHLANIARSAARHCPFSY